MDKYCPQLILWELATEMDRLVGWLADEWSLWSMRVFVQVEFKLWEFSSFMHFRLALCDHWQASEMSAKLVDLNKYVRLPFLAEFPHKCQQFSV